MSNNLLRVLMYHRVIEPTDSAAPNPALVSATPLDFQRQMHHLARHYAVVSAEAVLAAFRTGRPLPEHAVLITFDDAYRDFGEIAWPILRHYGLPATVFVSTAFPANPRLSFWWDRLYRALRLTQASELHCPPLGHLPLHDAESRRASLRVLQRHIKSTRHADALQLVDRICSDLGDGAALPAYVLTWDELRVLAEDGVTIGAHTQTHPALNQLPVPQMQAELRGCREELKRELGVAPALFAYPFGAHDQRVVDAVKAEGYELAFTCQEGHNPLSAADPLRLRRTSITLRTSPLIFQLRLMRWVSYVDTFRKSTGKANATFGH